MLSFTMHTILVLAVALFAALLQSSSAFVVSNNNCNLCTSYATQLLASPVAIPGTETETEEKREVYIPGEKKTPSTETGGAGNRGPIEYLIDDPRVSRDDNDPFHILLLDETFVKNSKITIEYVASSCTYVLGMPYDEAAELAAHAEKEGFSCLGTWSREECIRLGKQLQNRDLVCRVVPFCEGGDRAWQARNMEDSVWEM